MTRSLFSVVVFSILMPEMVRANDNIVVVLDDSGSMHNTLRSNTRIRKIDAAKDALRAVLENVGDDSKVGVLALNSRAADGSWIIPFGKINRQKIEARIQNIKAQRGTPLGEYLKKGADALLEARAKQLYGTYRLLVVTDGEASDKDLLERYLPDVLSRGITIDVIGVDMQARHGLATKVHSYRRADDEQSLKKALAEVMAESSDEQIAAGEVDYEVLEGFPSDVASVVLKTLAEVDNDPIGKHVAKIDLDPPEEAFSYAPLPKPRSRRSEYIADYAVAVIIAAVLLFIFKLFSKNRRQ